MTATNGRYPGGRDALLNDVAGLLKMATVDWLPLSVRYQAAEAAVAVVAPCAVAAMRLLGVGMVHP